MQIQLRGKEELKGVTVAQLAEAGTKRISTGGALARAAISAILRAGAEMRSRGTFGWVADVVPGREPTVDRVTPGAGARRRPRPPSPSLPAYEL